MAQKIIKVGKWYLIYEAASTIGMLAVAFFGFEVPAYLQALSGVNL